MATSAYPLHQLPGLSQAHAQGMAQLGFTNTAQLQRYGVSVRGT